MFRNDELGFESSYDTSMRSAVTRTYLWMLVGVLITGVIAALCSNSLQFQIALYTNPYSSWILLIAQIGVAVAFSARLFKMSMTTARILFLAYAALLGVTCSSLALVYDIASIAFAFILSAGYFLGLTVIGYTTKANLLKFGPILYTGLFVLIIVEVIMMLFGMDTSTMLFTAIGLALFTGITAYDTQKMKVLLQQAQGDEDMTKRVSIYSAFQLYLDFINIFIYIMRIVGSRD